MATSMNFIPLSPGVAERQDLAPARDQDFEQFAPGGPRLPRFRGFSRQALRKIALSTAAVLLLGGASVAAYNFVQHASTHQETDDAYVTGHLHQVSTRVPGTVARVLVDDNEHVKAGQLLVTLDPRDYQVKVNQAKAALATAMEQSHVARSTISYASTNAAGQVKSAEGAVSNAQAGIARAQASVSEAQAAIAQARSDLGAKEAELARAQSDFVRYTTLAAQGAVAIQELDNARRDYKVAEQNVQGAKDNIRQAEAKLRQAQELVNTSRAQLTEAQGKVVLAQASGAQTMVDERQFDVARASIEQAKAALDEASLNLSYTNIYAPTNGRVGKKTVEVGQRIEPGQPLLTVVSDESWVVANFKETQLKQMRPGDEVEIKIDSFPDHKFAGRVLSVAPGSGSSFALLPSDNATGNFTKIVQRVPVKIVFETNSLKGYEQLLVPGMSVVADVSTVKK
ncbi:MAG: HlyD family secretion protein [Cyanobacteria bacterium SZAS TMP-1]|nr:HlyD family secretion protein [Cyanobacteria bacterium SZAS TMP-1]